jgi:hypothetical protein
VNSSNPSKRINIFRRKKRRVLAYKGSFIQWIDADEGAREEEKQEEEGEEGRYWPYAKGGLMEGENGNESSKYYSITE